MSANVTPMFSCRVVPIAPIWSRLLPVAKDSFAIARIASALFFVSCVAELIAIENFASTSSLIPVALDRSLKRSFSVSTPAPSATPPRAIMVVNAVYFAAEPARSIVLRTVIARAESLTIPDSALPTSPNALPTDPPILAAALSSGSNSFES